MLVSPFPLSVSTCIHQNCSFTALNQYLCFVWILSVCCQVSSTLFIIPGPRAACNLNNSSSNTAAREKGDSRGQCLTLSQTLAQLWSQMEIRISAVAARPSASTVCTCRNPYTPTLVGAVAVNPLYETLSMMSLLHCTSNPEVEMWVIRFPRVPLYCAATPCH